MQIEDMGGCVRDWMDVSPGTAGQAILPGEFWGGGAPLSGEARRRRVRRGRWAAPAMQAEPVVPRPPQGQDLPKHTRIASNVPCEFQARTPYARSAPVSAAQRDGRPASGHRTSLLGSGNLASPPSPSRSSQAWRAVPLPDTSVHRSQPNLHWFVECLPRSTPHASKMGWLPLGPATSNL